MLDHSPRPNVDQLVRDVIEDGLAVSESGSAAGGYVDGALTDDELLPS
jgi:hypothetical protein